MATEVRGVSRVDRVSLALVQAVQAASHALWLKIAVFRARRVVGWCLLGIWWLMI
jgi:hypothetical protein